MSLHKTQYKQVTLTLAELALIVGALKTTKEFGKEHDFLRDLLIKKLETRL